MPDSISNVACALALALIGCSGSIAVQSSDGGQPVVTSDGGKPTGDGGTTGSDGSDGSDGPDGSIELDGSVVLPPRPASVTYPDGLRHSPIDATIAAHLEAMVNGNAREFAKVGDSITADTAFFTCFDGGSVDYGGRTDLSDTASFFLAGNVGGSSPFARSSLAAIRGATTADLLAGSPSPLSREISAIDPRFAVIMLGTNDIRYGRSYDAFGADLWAIVDQTIASGAVPVLSTMPPNNADSTADARIPTANRIVRAIAQGRRVPLVDYYREMLPLPSRGISSDGIHPTVASSGACQLNASGLQYGYNVRNLVSLEALSRARAAAAGTGLDTAVSRPAGNGTASDPYVVGTNFVDLNDNRSRTAQLAAYACNARTQSGGEVIYQVNVPTATTLDVLVVDRGTTDVDVHILQGSLAGSACVAGADHQTTATVSGTVYIVVDSPDDTTAGEYLLVVQSR